MFTFLAENHPMTEKAFHDLVQSLKAGDNSALTCLQSYQEECVRAVVRQSNGRCERDVAYDLFVESILDFRKNVLNDKVAYGNVAAYLKRICINKWLAEYRDNTRRHLVETQSETMHYQGDISMLDSESMEDVLSRQSNQLDTAMQQLSAQCRTILTMAIGDERSMKDIAEHLGLASADVAKTTKSRCYKKLLELIRKTPTT